MSLTRLATKTVFLRLEEEQLLHTIDGWCLNRSGIEDESLPEYDSQLEDIILQAQQQGINVLIDLEDSQKEMDELKDAIHDLSQYIGNIDSDPHERAQLHKKVRNIRTVLYGEL